MQHIPYTYLIGWSELQVFYYGRRTAKRCHPDEFWKTYFTSSQEVVKYRQIHGEPDIIRITKTFKDQTSCKIWEMKFLMKVDARNNPKFLNRVNSDYKLNPINTGPCSDSRRVNISNARKNTLKHACVHCGTVTDPGNLKKHHNDACIHNPANEVQDILTKRRETALKSFTKQLENGTYNGGPKPPQGIFTCPHCGKAGSNYGNMHLHHFDNCRIITGKKSKPFPVQSKCSCINCRRVLDLGNFAKHRCK